MTGQLLVLRRAHLRPQELLARRRRALRLVAQIMSIHHSEDPARRIVECAERLDADGWMAGRETMQDYLEHGPPALAEAPPAAGRDQSQVDASNWYGSMAVSLQGREQEDGSATAHQSGHLDGAAGP